MSRRQELSSLAPRANQALLTAQLLLNGLTGFLFVRLLAAWYGASASKDLFDIAYNVPFILISFGGLSFLHGLITVRIAQLIETDRGAISELYSFLSCWTLASGVVLVVISAAGAPQILHVLAPGLPTNLEATGIRLLRTLLPLVATYSFSALASATLIAFKQPVSLEFAQLVSRLPLLIVGYSLNSPISLEAIAVFLLIGSSIAALLQLLIVHQRLQLRFRWSFTPSGITLRDFGARGIWMVGAAIAAQLSGAVLRRIANSDAIGTTAAIGYSLALVTPLSTLIGKPFALVYGTGVVAAIASGDLSRASAELLWVSVRALALGVFAGVMLSVFSDSIITVAFRGGNFDSNAVELTRLLLSIFAWSMPGSILLWVLLMPVLADASPRIAGLIYIGGYLLQVLLYMLLFNYKGKAGLAWAYVAGVSFQALAAGLIVNRQIARKAV